MAKAPYLRIRVSPQQRSWQAIVDSVEKDLARGLLPAGGRLPPVRVLAHQLGISKTTVQTAYDELSSRGTTETSDRRGVYLVGGCEGAGPRPALPAVTPAKEAVPDTEFSLSQVFIDPDLLPVKEMTRSFRAVLRRGLPPHYQAQGYAPLRDLIAQRLRARGMEVSADEVVLTLGSQQALDIACRALERRCLATENPAYSIGKQLFEMNQMELHGLPLEPFGELPLERWRDILQRVRPALVYLTTNFQNPTGYSYSTAELTEILRLSEEFGFGIIEDDWGSDMLSFSEYRPPLRALAGPEVLYMNSFTKKLLPSLRLGYLVAHPRLVPTLVAAKRVATLANPILEEMALCDFLERGCYDQHLRRLQKQLDRRYLHCLEVLERTLPEEVRFSRPGGGPLVWLELPRDVDLLELKENLAGRGLHIRVDPDRFFGTPHLHGFPLGFAGLKPARLEEGIEILAEALREGRGIQ